MNKLKSLQLALQGKKLYICAVLAGVVFVLKILDVLDEGTANILFSLLGFGGITALGARVSRSLPKG